MPYPALEEFQIGWICALHIEMVAATEMLDESFGTLPEQDTADTSSYILGRIGVHYVVIVCGLGGKYGLGSAAIVANNMIRTFPSLRVGLIVETGGGIPSETNDIRLGDIVVSYPQDTCGGVIQYDFGKAELGGTFRRVGSINSPPRVLLSAVNSMRGAMLTDDPRYLEYMERVIESTTNSNKQFFSRPDARDDRLFRVNYEHPISANGCDECPVEWEEKRPERDENYPLPHYGIIASGNSEVRHGSTREHIRQETGALCVEMQAAGIMLDFPCIAICGICDYADSHKSADWQGYSALAAAAYAKELLGYVPRGQVSQKSAKDMCSKWKRRSTLRVKDDVPFD